MRREGGHILDSAEEAEAAGFRAAKNCPDAAPEAVTTRAADIGTSANSPSSPGRVQVRGYYRKDGTFVRPPREARRGAGTNAETCHC